MKRAQTTMRRRAEQLSRDRASRRAAALFCLAVAGAALPAKTGAQTITEFPLPFSGAGPADIAAGPDGNVWFVETAANRIGRITTTGVVTEFEVPTAGSRPISIAAGPDGNLWFLEQGSNKVGRITTGGVVTGEFPVPTRTNLPVIAAGPDGNLWFTEPSADSIGRITTTGVITEFRIPVNSTPIGIVAGPDGNIWYTDYYGDKIGRMSTTGVVRTFQVSSDTWPSRITVGPDGNLWYVSSLGGIGQITTEGVATDFLPASPIQISQIVAGPDGNIWFTSVGSNSLGYVTTSGVFTLLPLPTPNASPTGITLGPDGNIWFTEATAGKIGRVELGTGGACVPGPATLCLDGGRFQVQSEWRVPSEGRSGAGTAVGLTNETGFFWFFDPDNLEVVVKVLNGCSVSGHEWVFAAGLTSVEVMITVTDTATSLSKTYRSAAGAPFPPIQDTAAFPCP